MCCFVKMQFVILLFVFVVQMRTEKCITPNDEEAECVSLRACPILNEALDTEDALTEDFVQKSICGGSRLRPKVCCGSLSNFTSLETTDSLPKKTNARKGNVLPDKRYCGYQHSDDYLRPINDTSIRITEFPWLARILYYSKGSGRAANFRCGGSLINNRYVLTSGSCIGSSRIIPLLVRLGEYNVHNETDCIQELQFEQECSNFVDFGIEKAIPHEHYDEENHTNDIGLLKLNGTVEYSDYIRPICLPQPGIKLAEVGNMLTSSGFGLTRQYDESEFKKKVFTELISNERCTQLLQSTQDGIFVNNPITITENHMCSLHLEDNDNVQCNGDAGAPVMFSNNRFQWHLEGVISFGVGPCATYRFPEVHTRVVNYLDWIKENMEP